jgi:hypothetical protein
MRRRYLECPMGLKYERPMHDKNDGSTHSSNWACTLMAQQTVDNKNTRPTPVQPIPPRVDFASMSPLVHFRAVIQAQLSYIRTSRWISYRYGNWLQNSSSRISSGQLFKTYELHPRTQMRHRIFTWWRGRIKVWTQSRLTQSMSEP